MAYSVYVLCTLGGFILIDKLTNTVGAGLIILPLSVTEYYWQVTEINRDHRAKQPKTSTLTMRKVERNW